jgi:hypothetical protein
MSESFDADAFRGRLSRGEYKAAIASLERARKRAFNNSNLDELQAVWALVRAVIVQANNPRDSNRANRLLSYVENNIAQIQRETGLSPSKLTTAAGVSTSPALERPRRRSTPGVFGTAIQQAAREAEGSNVDQARDPKPPSAPGPVRSSSMRQLPLPRKRARPGKNNDGKTEEPTTDEEIEVVAKKTRPGTRAKQAGVQVGSVRSGAASANTPATETDRARTRIVIDADDLLGVDEFAGRGAQDEVISEPAIKPGAVDATAPDKELIRESTTLPGDGEESARVFPAAVYFIVAVAVFIVVLAR